MNATVVTVYYESPAASSGLQTGDVITTIGNTTIVRPLDVERAFLGRNAGDPVEVSVRRNQQAMTVSLSPAHLPYGSEKHVAGEPVWDVLGLKLEPVPAKNFQQTRTHYRGGLAVTDVRNDSPAARQGIRRGDILVGMHVWYTVSIDNVTFSLGRPDFAQLDPLKFYILRGNETLYGHLTVANRTARDSR